MIRNRTHSVERTEENVFLWIPFKQINVVSEKRTAMTLQIFKIFFPAVKAWNPYANMTIFSIFMRCATVLPQDVWRPGLKSGVFRRFWGIPAPGLRWNVMYTRLCDWSVQIWKNLRWKPGKRKKIPDYKFLKTVKNRRQRQKRYGFSEGYRKFYAEYCALWNFTN